LLGCLDGLRHCPCLNFAEGVFSPTSENVRDAAVRRNHHGVRVHEWNAELLGKLLADRRLANRHGADEDNGTARTAVLNWAAHYRPTESRVAGMFSR
jgi:hypothetical protein